MKCKDCKWWELEFEDNAEGFCHKYAPRLVEGMMILGDDETLDRDSDGLCEKRRYMHIWDGKDALWPKTREYGWCGEFESKEQQHSPDDFEVSK